MDNRVMPVRLNSSGGGSVTLDVPATGTTTTLTLPITGGGLAASGSVTTSGLTMNTSRLLGRTTASSGAVEEISVGTGLTLSAGTLSASGGAAPQLQEQLFTSSGTWTAPTGVTRVQAIVIGGGGGARSGDNNFCSAGGSGGPGGVAVGLLTVVPGTTYTVTVGAGGAGRAVNLAQNGSPGGTSSFGALISATGGAGGTVVNGAAGAGTGGTTRNTDVAVIAPSPFDGTMLLIANNPVRGVRRGGAPAVTWTTSLTEAAGSAGLGQVALNGAGGVSGIVYLQWVG